MFKLTGDAVAALLYAAVLLCCMPRFCYNRGMRITGGEFCGRRLAVPVGEKVRPTQDRVREALFSMLMHETDSALFLDLFAGSGAVGLEALSRGAGRVIWVEQSNRHVTCLRRNRELIAPGSGEIVCADVMRWLRTGGRGLKADIVFADPPYAESLKDGLGGVAGLVAENDVLAPGGLFVGEMSSGRRAEELPGWSLLKDRVYGQTRLTVYRRES